MNKLVLCSTGTSIANGCSALRQTQGHETHWNDEAKELQAQLDEKLASADGDYTNRQKRRRLSAELNTLDHIGISKGDVVVLLATDSAPGRICSQKTKEIIEEVYEVNVKVECIEGLQVYNAERLRKVGLKNLVKVVLDEYLDKEELRYSYDIIMNPTGGYKGIVPFLTVLGMLYGLKSVYLFEFSEELIELPPLPLTFDLKLYERVRDALKYMEKEVAVTEQAFLAKIQDVTPEETPLFLSFTEPYDDGLITLSPLAYVFVKMEEGGQVCEISSEVEQTLEKLTGEKRIIIERLITRSSNPLWRNNALHRWKNSPILIIKQGNTAERLAGYINNGVFHVALAFASHDTYEKELGKYVLDDLKKMDYSPWIPDEKLETELSDFDALLRERDLLSVEKERLQNRLLSIQEQETTAFSRLEEERDESKIKAMELEEACDESKTKMMTLEKQRNESHLKVTILEEEVVQLKNKMASLEVEVEKSKAGFFSKVLGFLKPRAH